MNALSHILAEAAEPSLWTPLGERTERLELPIQVAFRKRAKVVCPRVRVIAVPNAGKRGPKAAAQAKLEGLWAGMVDTICMWPEPGWIGGKQIALIEFKRGDATASAVEVDQREMLDWLEAAGFPCVVSRHEDHALGFLRDLGAPFIDRVGRL